MAPPALAAPATPKIHPRTVDGPAMQAPTSKRHGLRKKISLFQNFIVGASIARPLKPCAAARPPRVEQSPTPTINRERVRINFIAISQFHRRGGAPLRPGLPNPQPRKYTPAPLAGLQCRPLQAKGMACVKKISLFQNFIVGASIARPGLPLAGPCGLPACLPIDPVLRFLFGNVRSATHCGVISPESEPK